MKSARPPRPARKAEPYLTIQATPAQLDRLADLGVLTAAQLEAGRQAGGLEVRLPAAVVEEFWRGSGAGNPPTEGISRLAARLHQAGMTGPARLFLATGRPLSFFGSQLLLLAQPVSRLVLGASDPTAGWGRLLEDRRNVDSLLAELDRLERSGRAGPPPSAAAHPDCHIESTGL